MLVTAELSDGAYGCEDCSAQKAKATFCDKCVKRPILGYFNFMCAQIYKLRYVR